MSHDHCSKCFKNNCTDTSSCPIIYCPNGCSASMHGCKRDDHEYICSHVFVPCVNVSYGCPVTLRRCDLTRHLHVCPASITVCSFVYNHIYQLDKLDYSTDRHIVDRIARRDNIWCEHIAAFEKAQEELSRNAKYEKTKRNHVESVIRSQKYPYITMPQCMLGKDDGVVCSTCRLHLRQLEHEEEQRLSTLSEDERRMMMNLNPTYDDSVKASTVPSLVKMSSTLINSSEAAPISSLSYDVPSTTPQRDSLQKSQLGVISDIELPSSFLYRLNFFSSYSQPKTVSTFNRSPRFQCNALCRRDEMEQHWQIHFQVDTTLNTSFFQQCPKAQYGCPFQYECIEPCKSNGESIQMRFDEVNDAIAFEWYPTIGYDYQKYLDLLRFPTEILINILQRLDSLSLRNVSIVCRRLRLLCQGLLPAKGIVVSDYQRNVLLHGDVTWIERQKHWLFTNTTSVVPKWQLKSPDKYTSLSQHLTTCSYGETKDLQNEPPFPLVIRCQTQSGPESTSDQ